MLNNENDDIMLIENIDDYISSLSNEEVILKLSSFSKICEGKIKEMQELFTDISKKEDKINKLTSTSRNDNNSMRDNTNSNIPYPSDGTRNEESELRKEYQHNLNELEKEYHKQLQNDLNNIEISYKNELTQIINEHDNKVKNLHYEIQRLQYEIEEMKEGGDVKYITKEEHQNKMKKLFNEHAATIEKYDKQIEQMEKQIAKKNPKMINKNVNGIEFVFPKVEHDINSQEQIKQKEELFMTQIKKIKELNKQNGKIILLSQLQHGNVNNVNNPRESMFVVPTENSDLDYNECLVDDDNDNKTNPIRSEHYQIHLSNMSSIKKH